MRNPSATAKPFVSRLEAFGVLPDEDKLLLAELAAGVRQLPANTDLICEGDRPQEVQLFLSGFACRYKANDEGKRQVLAFFLPGDFSDLDVHLSFPMDHSIGTMSNCLVVSIRPDMLDAMHQRPALARALRMATLVEAAIAREWIVNIGRRDCLERGAHLICELLVRLDAVGLVESDGFSLPLTQTDLADASGTSIVHMNRVLRQLREAGLIEMKSRRITVLDVGALKKLGGFVPDYLHLGQVTIT